MITRVLIIGSGSIGQRHLRIARELLPAAHIKVLKRKTTSLPADTDIGDVFFTLEQGLAFKPEIVVVANPATFHLKMAIPFAEIGSHLLIEKPLATDLKGIDDLLATIARSGSKVIVGYNLRHCESLQQFRRLVSSGKCGKVLAINSVVGQYLPTWRPDKKYQSSVSASADLGGGALLELSHEIDYLRWIFGEVNWTMAVSRKQSALDIDVEDIALMIFELEAALCGHKILASLSLDLLRQAVARTCTVIGDRGTLQWDGIGGTVDYCSIGENKFKRVFQQDQESENSYYCEWRDFLKAIDGDTTSSASIQDGLAVLKIIDAIRRSSCSGVKTFVVRTHA